MVGHMAAGCSEACMQEALAESMQGALGESTLAGAQEPCSCMALEMKALDTMLEYWRKLGGTGWAQPRRSW